MLAVLLGFAAIAATGTSPTAVNARPETVAVGASAGSRLLQGSTVGDSVIGGRASMLTTDLAQLRPALSPSLYPALSPSGGNSGSGTALPPAAPVVQGGGLAFLNPGLAVLNPGLTVLNPRLAAVDPGLGGLDTGLIDWFASHQQEHTVAQVVTGSGNTADPSPQPRLEVTAASSRGAVAQDFVIRPQAGHTYSAAVRARSLTGFPVLVELAVHALDDSGAIGETNSRLVMVEGYEVPITATLEPTADHASLRVEVYVHTVERTVELGDVSVLIDDQHDGPANLGYQQPRVRYLDDPLTGPVDLADLEPGGLYRVEVSVDTTTDQPWRCCPDLGAIRLGTEDEDLVGGSGRSSALFTPAEVDGSAWISANRIAFDRAESTFGGSFITTITAPTDPGPFSERFRLVSEHVTWLPGPVIEIIGSVTVPSENGPPESGPTESGTPADQEDGRVGLLVECPPNLSLAAPGDRSTDCAVDVDGFDPVAAEIGAGIVTLNWSRPVGVTGTSFLVEVEDWSLPEGAERRNGIRTVEVVGDDPDPTAALSATVDLAPGRYGLRVLAVDDSGRLVRSRQLPVEVVDPAPVFEADVPAVGCRSENGVVLPGFCPPDEGPVDPPTDDGPADPPGEDGPVDDLPPTPQSACRTARLIFGGNVLMRYSGHDRSDPLPIRLPCARYEIVLRSTDPEHAVGYQAEQTEERWYLQVLGSDGTVLFTSAPTPDLPDHQTGAEYSVGAADLTGAAAVVARHTGQGSSANSVTVSAELRPLD